MVWKTTPNDPLPTILHCVYCISLVSPVRPSCTFSRTTSVGMCQRTCSGKGARMAKGSGEQRRHTAHAQTREHSSRPVLRHCRVLGACGIHFGDGVGGWDDRQTVRERREAAAVEKEREETKRQDGRHLSDRRRASKRRRPLEWTMERLEGGRWLRVRVGTETGT